ncbi:hypothetical protein IFR05_013763 [Cadophora sp. M221]|nr:hypothetical protein IFR05_013763 [Cadophora sp. M221]
MHAKSISGYLALLVLTMAIGAVAAPAPATDTAAAPANGGGCIPGFYVCDNNRYPVGTVVCDATRKWVNAANCGAGQSCACFDGVPHCV